MTLLLFLVFSLALGARLGREMGSSAPLITAALAGFCAVFAPFAAMIFFCF